ncbi:ethylbenzene dehydrogenase-related protein [Haloarcula marismortui]|uniref:DMSO reductase family type II enzyme, heme b subunit n=1 Tax=Haloarcula marismortui ATCC 33799 TaxID=662475 RepID=M0JWN0_9EURY|nr:ethylbenzene dehydrogenase-related protein [Haloarcula californiae]EMA12379.1 DMSO reductase family type II enzyme, heme b subunit [Haloarcula californiae ATCC 33799]
MTDHRRTLTLTAVLSALIVVSTVAAPMVSARPAHEIPVSEVSTADLAEPNADGWEEVPASDVPLASAPSSVPNADETSVETVDVQAARTDERLYVRLEWHDATRDMNANAAREFADAVAVQFPANTSSRPPIAMGGPDNRVNVWYWSGATGTQELLAGGAGSTTPFENPTVRTNASYTGTGGNATWTVVYSRQLDAPSENRTDLRTDGDLDVAFAVWNGSNGERSGQKAVSEWHYYPFSGGPQGPPYETLLWTVAGIAIVGVVGVTSFGIYRTRGAE